MLFKRKKITNTPFEQLSLLDLIKQFIISKLPQQKKLISSGNTSQQPSFENEEITYIAIVLDGVVEDVMRAQNRLAALVLSQPEFVEFDPKKDRPQIGETKYVNGKFETPLEELMDNNQIKETLKKNGGQKRR